MAYPRPKILSEIIVPSAGWDLDFSISVAGSYDTPLTATIPAGTYYMAWDAQSDDLVWRLEYEMKQAIIDAGLGTGRHPTVNLNSAHKIEIRFRGPNLSGAPQNHVELTLTTSSAELLAAIGFDGSSDLQSTGTNAILFTADYQHAYGWYADADGQLASLRVEDSQRTNTPQAVDLDGRSAAVQMGSYFENELVLQWLPRQLVYSRGVNYGDAPVGPYLRNVPLECWWHQAKLGHRFRVYREGRTDSTAPIDAMEATAYTNSSVTAAGKSFSVDPDEHLNRILMVLDRTTTAGLQPARFAISGHTAQTLTSYNTTGDRQSWLQAAADQTCYVLDQRYETYVVDLNGMSRFAPAERPGVDYHDISIPLLRYEA